MFRFKCPTCDEWHEGMPAFGPDAPLYFDGMPEGERSKRCKLSTDTCVVDDEFYFVRGCIEIPVNGHEDRFTWLAWISLSRASYEEFVANYALAKRSQFGPYFGWLSVALPLYSDTVNLKTRAHLRDNGIRPYIELEPTNHPLAIEQRNGISVERVAEFVEHLLHPDDPRNG